MFKGGNSGYHKQETDTIDVQEGIALLVSYKTIGRNIRAARLASNLTQEQAAEKLQISQLHFGRLERGERPPSLELLAQIAQAFGVSFVSLLCGCVTEVPTVRKLSEGDAHAVSRTVEAIASGCTPRAQQLMVALCQEVARIDKHASRE